MTDVVPEIVELCSSIGSKNANTHQYEPSEFASDCVRYLLRLLKHDDPESRSIFMLLGQLKVVENDLIPLLLASTEDFDICFDICKVLVLLTMPLEGLSNTYYQELRVLVDYKRLCSSSGVLTAVMALCAVPLSHEGVDRTDEDNMVIELVLTLFRNLLAIPVPDETQSSSSVNYSYLQDNLIRAFQTEAVFDVLILLAQNLAEEENRGWALIVTEILFYLIRHETPADIYRVSEAPREKQQENEDRLRRMIEAQERSRLSRVSALPTRHSRFGGAFVVNRSIVSKDVSSILGSNTTNINYGTVPVTKRTKPRSTNTNSKLRTHEARTALKQFVNEFMRVSFNGYVRYMKFELMEQRGSHILESDNNRFLIVMGFLMGLYRLQAASDLQRDESIEFDVGIEAEALDLQMFRFVFRRARMCADGQTSEDGKLDSEGLEACSYALRELISHLYYLASSSTESNRQFAYQLENTLFYEMDALDLFVELNKRFQRHVYTMKYMENCIAINDMLFRLFEYNSEEGYRLITIKQRRRKIHHENEKEHEHGQGEGEGEGEREGEGEVDTTMTAIESEPVEKEEVEDATMPVDGDDRQPEEPEEPEEPHTNNIVATATAETTTTTTTTGTVVGEQQSDANMGTVRGDTAVDAMVGDEDVTPQPQHYRRHHKSVVEDETEQQEQEQEPEQPDALPQRTIDAENEQVIEDEETIEREVEIEQKQLLKNLCSKHIIDSYVFVLEHYMTLDPDITIAIVRLFRMIVNDLHRGPVLYQLSLVRIMDTILHDPIVLQAVATFPSSNDVDENLISTNKHLAELCLFASTLMSAMVSSIERNPLVGVEVLFWKSKSAALAISNNYEDKNVKMKEGRRQAIENMDELEVIPTKRQQREMREMEEAGTAAATATATSNTKPRRRKFNWTDEEDEVLQTQYPQFKDLDSCNDILATYIGREVTPRQVAARLRKLGLVKPAKKPNTNSSSTARLPPSETATPPSSSRESSPTPSMARIRHSILSSDSEQESPPPESTSSTSSHTSSTQQQQQQKAQRRPVLPSFLDSDSSDEELPLAILRKRKAQQSAAATTTTATATATAATAENSRKSPKTSTNRTAGASELSMLVTQRKKRLLHLKNKALEASSDEEESTHTWQEDTVATTATATAATATATTASATATAGRKKLKRKALIEDDSDDEGQTAASVADPSVSMGVFYATHSSHQPSDDTTDTTLH